MRVFLDIDIGDAAAHADAAAAHARAAAFLAAVGSPQLGLPPRMSDLDEDGAALLLDAYAADKGWSAQGPALVAAPPPLRAGRLVCELFEKEVPKVRRRASRAGGRGCLQPRPPGPRARPPSTLLAAAPRLTGPWRRGRRAGGAAHGPHTAPHPSSAAGRRPQRTSGACARARRGSARRARSRCT